VYFINQKIEKKNIIILKLFMEVNSIIDGYKLSILCLLIAIINNNGNFINYIFHKILLLNTTSIIIIINLLLLYFVIYKLKIEITVKFTLT